MAGRAGQTAFAIFNDPVLAMLAMLDGGVSRIAYLDIDAHHGDGVQAAFHDDDRVLTVSLHEDMRWPMAEGSAGRVDDRAGGFACNLPVPPGFNDSEHLFLMETVVLPLIDDFAPQALVLQCGADGLEEDPLSKLSLSNLALWRTVALVRDVTPRCLVLGGGGL